MVLDQDLQVVPAGILRWPSYVLGRLHRHARDAIEQALHEEGLSVRAYFVLVCIDEVSGASQQQVADSLRIDRSDLVKLLDQMQDQGLITRERDPADRRRQLLTLTPPGQDALARGTQVSHQITDTALGNLTLAERRTLHALALKALGLDLDG